MHYVYVIYSPSADDIYYGETDNIARRLKEHRRGNNESTTQAADWQLVYYEAYQSPIDARERERRLKDYGAARGHLKNRISRSLNDIE